MINGDATFVAPATPYGHSGLAVVRINGPKSLETLSKLAPNAKLKDRSAVLSKIRTSSGELIDECVVTFFKSPKSGMLLLKFILSFSLSFLFLTFLDKHHVPLD